MLRVLAVSAALLGCHMSAKAQLVRGDTTSNWKKALRLGLNLNQAAFSSNWKAGGSNSVGFNSLLNAKANYKTDSYSWDNEADFLYGSINNQGQGYRKTNDRIYLDTKFGKSLTPSWDLAVSLNFISQFAKGYSYETNAAGVEVDSLISDLFAPAFLTAAFGFEYHPVPYFKVRLSPYAPRITAVKDVERFVTGENPTPFGVTPPEDIRYEFLSGQMVAELDKEIAKNITLKVRYLLFVNYENFSGDQMDQRLDLSLNGKVNEFINVNLSGTLLYDYDQDKGLQSTEALSLGFLFAVQNFK
jgi:hypothetical protein